jgi:putative ABC transport system permease protein
MILNYLIIALRNLSNNKVHTLINVTGLALGIASVFLITLYVKHEMGYDRYYPGYENIYRIVWENENPQTRTPHPMAQAMADDFPEVESAVSLSPLWAPGLTREIFSFRNPEKNLQFDESNVLSVDTTFFDVFGFPVVRGDAKRALKNVNGLLISESIAKKYFGDDDPIGKHLAVNSDTMLLEVMAVFKDIPDQSHIHFDMLVSYVREKFFDPDDDYYTWADFGHFNYLRLRPGTDHKQFESKLMEWSGKYISWPEGRLAWYAENHYGFKVQPVKDIHLKSNLRWELEANGNMEYVFIMSAAALLTLVIACINFMNLMTAKSAERAKEIGIRKTLGALRKQLAMQFLSESMITALLSIMLAVLLVELSLPFYNSVTGYSFDMKYIEAAPALIALGALVGALSGIYPSIVLSAVQPHAILKGNTIGSSKGSSLRKALIVFQFAISMTLVSSAAIIFNQLDYIQHKHLGFDKEEVLVIPLKNEMVSRRMEALKTELLRIDGVVSVSASSNLPGGQFNQNPVVMPGNPEEDVDFSEAYVDYDFLKTLNIELAEGRFFLPENRADSAVSFVINETGERQLNLDQAVGKQIQWEVGDTLITGTVIGVMNDFHFQSFHRPVQPLLFVLYPAYNHLVIKLNTQDFEEKIAQIKHVYASFDDAFDFEFSFLDDRLTQQYRAEHKTAFVFGAFAFVAIAIAASGYLEWPCLRFINARKKSAYAKCWEPHCPG